MDEKIILYFPTLIQFTYVNTPLTCNTNKIDCTYILLLKNIHIKYIFYINTFYSIIILIKIGKIYLKKKKMVWLN